MNKAASNATGLDLLRVPFAPNQISKLPKETKAQSENRNARRKCDACGGFHHPDAVHLDYVGHAALTDRLLDADLKWEWTPLAFDEHGLPLFDKTGGLWIKLTVCGMTRLGYGNAEGKSFMDVGSREKEVIGDALRNAAMRFGAALDLWHKGDLHGDGSDDKGDDKPDPQNQFRADWEVMILDSTTRDGLETVWKDFKKAAENLPYGAQVFAQLKPVVTKKLESFK